METKSMKFVSLRDSIHLGGPSYEISETFKRLVQGNVIDVSKIELITVNYNVSQNNLETWPVRIYCSNGLAIYLKLTAGYSGAGPHDLVSVLELCNIKFDKNDILSNQDVVNLKYVRDTNIVYQFKNSYGEIVYSI